MRKTMRKSKLALVLFALTTVPLWTAGCGKAKGSDTSAAAQRPTPVKTEKARYGPIKKTLFFTGNIFAVRETRISSKIPGKIDKIMVDKGVDVKANDKLILIDQEDLAVVLMQAEAGFETANAALTRALAGTRTEQMEQARAGLTQARANLDYANLMHGRMSDLLNSSAIPKNQYDLVKMQLDMAEAQHKAAQEQVNMAEKGATEEDINIVKANVKIAAAGLLGAKTMFNNSVIKAPFDGTIVMKTMNEGETIGPGIPLLFLSDMTTVKVEFGIPEKYYSTINKGGKGIVKVDAYPGHTFTGVIKMKNPSVDMRSRMFDVRIEIPNTDEKFKLVPGMFARIDMVMDEKERTLLVPSKAVLEREGKKCVMVIGKDGRPRERTVETGLINKYLVEIISGLKAGEEVIVEGNYGLKPGSPVKVEK